jgi:hypothetical protein
LAWSPGAAHGGAGACLVFNLLFWQLWETSKFNNLTIGGIQQDQHLEFHLSLYRMVQNYVLHGILVVTLLKSSIMAA